MNGNKKPAAQKGYVLAAVLVVTFFMTALVLSTFTASYRYLKATEDGIDDLREYVISEVGDGN